eukprot:4774802-Amphidinium_carterae.2
MPGPPGIRWRHCKKRGWFTCRGFGSRLPKQAGGNTVGQARHCQNCCHNKQCGIQTCMKRGAKIEGKQGKVSRWPCSSCTA